MEKNIAKWMQTINNLREGSIHKFEHEHGAGSPILCIMDGNIVTCIYFDEAMKKSHLILPKNPSKQNYDSPFLNFRGRRN